MNYISLIGQGFYEALAMFWATLWALVLGFALSGAVQAFIPRGTMQNVLGGDDPASLSKATFFGMISSSCSYAASALAKSLFKGGANFTASMVFMFASTNLVLELGIVLWVLMGWNFALAEFVGGGLMIVLFAFAARFVFARSMVESARSDLQDEDATSSGESDSDASGRTKVTERMKSLAGWADAAGYAMADITMLYKEMIFGFVVAGFLATIIPDSVWSTIFVTGFGFWTSLENVLVGPLLAVISFVCSVGNVPLAAALWAGGISFGGVASFIFADLITLPLILIYRKFYGTQLTIRLVATLWAAMSFTGLVIEYLFAALGLVPAHQMDQIAGASFEWNYTTFLNILFLAVFAGLFWMSRNQKRLGGGAGYATDPMCGMQVEMANAPATAVVDNRTYYFCSDHCRANFTASHAAS
ncbi:permease [Salinisphaera orenii]|uniref:permease n=1 Tax=Salinisphaera orenii TaxID=856731 RepID=UPI000DBEA8F2